MTETNSGLHGDTYEHTVDQWSRRLTQALQILDFEVDQNLVRELSEKSSQHVAPSAGAVTALIVGYAAGLRTTSGKRAADEAVRSAANIALDLAGDGPEGGPDRIGWTDTGQ
jgi:hypothetical protein